MNEIYTQFISIMYGIWCNRKLALIVAWSVSFAGWAYIYTIPNVYESKARLHFDSDRVLTPLMSDLTVDNNIYSQILNLRETLLGRDNIKRVIYNTDIKNLYASEAELEENIEELVSDIADGFYIEPETASLFSMSFVDLDPVYSYTIVQGFLDAFMGGQLVDNSTELSSALNFIEDQLIEQEQKLQEAEQRRSAFMQNNMPFLSSTGQSYFQSLSTARQESADVQLLIDELESQKAQIIEYREQLPPYVSSLGLGPLSGAQRVTLETRIATMVTQMDELYVRGYKDLHPDIIILRQQINSLEEQLVTEKSNLVKALGDGDTSLLTSLDGLRPNPLFDQLSLNLIEIEGEIAGLDARKSQRDATVDQLLDLSQRVPEVEAEEARLNRDYEVILGNYNSLLSKREDTKMSQALKNTSQGIIYSLIEPARIPDSPFSPDRLLLIVLSICAGVFAGCGIAFVKKLHQNSFSSEQRLRDVFNLPVLGSVSAILSKNDEVIRRRSLITSSIMFGSLFVAGVFVYILLENMNNSII